MEARYEEPKWSAAESARSLRGHPKGAIEPEPLCVVCVIVLLLNNLHSNGLEPQSVKWVVFLIQIDGIGVIFLQFLSLLDFGGK